ncbi:energy-coupling factor transporter transmembrane component T [Pseudoclavibacter sp. CFCC 13611]|uniref:energy-coupling factor transporter transmembrane component T n=1 Tax=Pseudoclavibacter sp. CFCC 13611 TaxID=2615178 RepID=UPI0013016BB7|nr:energy-coupling factor transporter transmembrane component T [Pseudoclavibacter sp. CFCC 13611]KAB1662660.1 energy-coupling factor transporter transmembrane protein EcfT [Pseudoclavibacter sp. CFCC 13611]
MTQQTLSAATVQVPSVMRSTALLDPRTKLLALFLINTIAYGTGSLLAQFLAAVAVALLLATLRDRKPLAIYAITYAVSTALYLALPHLITGWLPALLVAVGFWVARFAITIGYFAYFLLSTGPSELTAALATLRVPRLISVPLAVVLRFVPTVIDELRAIVDAMRLRGLASSASALALHPISTTQHVLLPLLASTSRIADELSASALIRGLGRPERPTTVVRLRFGLADAGMLVFLGVLVAVSVMNVGVSWSFR